MTRPLPKELSVVRAIRIWRDRAQRAEALLKRGQTKLVQADVMDLEHAIITTGKLPAGPVAPALRQFLKDVDEFKVPKELSTRTVKP